METIPRAYQTEADLHKMCALLQTGCKAQTNVYYIHPGELNLCLYNWLAGQNPWQAIYLWDDPASPDRLLGWGLLSTPWSGFDVFVQPELWNSAWSGQANTWVEEEAIRKGHEQGHRHLWRMNVAETDEGLRERLAGRDFEEFPDYAMLSMECDLSRELPQYSLPKGYIARPTEEFDTADRAAVQHRAFEMEITIEEHLQRYRHFMASPGYTRGRDWIVADADRHVISFCGVWPDSVSLMGQIDPVGTHPDFQQRGFGKVVVATGLQYLRSVGMQSARICVQVGNKAAVKLYESIGFQVTNRLLTYRKSL